MKKITIALVLFIPVSLFSLDLYEEFAVGYYGDLGATLGLRVENPTAGFPLYFQCRIGTAYQFEPGNAEDARRIFINDNQGGNIREFGQSFFLSLDLGWKKPVSDSFLVEVSASGLVNFYMAHFSFIGNNEVFAAKTVSPGVGIGGGLRVFLSRSGSSLILKGGLEFYPKSKITAHGTFFYTPDDRDDNPRNSYTYEDADKAINQPFFRPYIQIGILFPVGRG